MSQLFPTVQILNGGQAVLENIDVVCATSIGCGMGPLDSRTFPFIVIDEAAQVPRAPCTLHVFWGVLGRRVLTSFVAIDIH